MKERVLIESVDDVIPVLNKHERLIFKNRSAINLLSVSTFFIFAAGAITGVLLYDLCKRVKDNSYKEECLRDQVNDLESIVLNHNEDNLEE